MLSFKPIEQAEPCYMHDGLAIIKSKSIPSKLSNPTDTKLKFYTFHYSLSSKYFRFYGSVSRQLIMLLRHLKTKALPQAMINNNFLMCYFV